MNAKRYILRWVNATGGDWLDPTEEFVGLVGAKNAAHLAYVNQDIDRDDIIQVFAVPFSAGDDPIVEFDRQDFDLS